MWGLDQKEGWALKNWCFWTMVLAKTLESPLDCKEIQPVHPKGDQSWVFIERTDAEAETLATSCEEVTLWKRPWFWEGLGGGGEGDDRGWDGWMASPTQWTWVWVNSGSWWWTGRPGVLRFMGSQRVGHDWATELNWTEGNSHTQNLGRIVSFQGNVKCFLDQFFFCLFPILHPFRFSSSCFQSQTSLLPKKRKREDFIASPT